MIVRFNASSKIFLLKPFSIWCRRIWRRSSLWSSPTAIKSLLCNVSPFCRWFCWRFPRWSRLFFIPVRRTTKRKNEFDRFSPNFSRVCLHSSLSIADSHARTLFDPMLDHDALVLHRSNDSLFDRSVESVVVNFINSSLSVGDARGFSMAKIRIRCLPNDIRCISSSAHHERTAENARSRHHLLHRFGLGNAQWRVHSAHGYSCSWLQYRN